MSHTTPHLNFQIDRLTELDGYNHTSPENTKYITPLFLQVRQGFGDDLDGVGDGAAVQVWLHLRYKYGQWSNLQNKYTDIITLESDLNQDNDFKISAGSDDDNRITFGKQQTEVGDLGGADGSGMGGEKNLYTFIELPTATEIYEYYNIEMPNGGVDLIECEILGVYMKGNLGETRLRLAISGLEYPSIPDVNNPSEDGLGVTSRPVIPSGDLEPGENQQYEYFKEDRDNNFPEGYINRGNFPIGAGQLIDTKSVQSTTNNFLRKVSDNFIFDSETDIEIEIHNSYSEIFTDEEFSDNFGVPNIDIEQTLLQPFDPFSGLDIDMGSFQNTNQGLLNSNQDGRIALGMFVFNDDNLNSDYFPSQGPDFKTIYKPNLINNGSGRFILSKYTHPAQIINDIGGSGILAEISYFIPDGGWGYCTYDGIETRKRDIDLYGDGGSYIEESSNGENFIDSFNQSGGEPNDNQNRVGYAGYYPYFFDHENSLLRLSYDLFASLYHGYNTQNIENSCNLFFHMNHYDCFLDSNDGYEYQQLTNLFADDGTLGIEKFKGVKKSFITSPAVEPTGWNSAPTMVGWPNFAKWIISDEAYSYGKCLEFLSTNFSKSAKDVQGNGWDEDEFNDLRPFSWVDDLGDGVPKENQYRSLNQVIEFYRGGFTDTSNLLSPYSSLKVSFKMKTDSSFVGNYEQPEVELAVVDSDGDIYNPMRWIDETTYNFFPYPLNLDNIPTDGTYPYNKKHIYFPHGDFNSQTYNDDLHSDGTVNAAFSNYGSMGRFKNTVMDEWEEFSFSFTLGNNFLYSDTNYVRRLFLIVQAANNFYGRVLLDDFKIIESYEFTPDVDVRKKISVGNYGKGDLTQYYDKELQPDEYKDTTAPLEAQFYFYPTYPTDEIFDVKRTPIYRDFKKGLFFIYDIDWGDGSPKEFTTKLEQIDEETPLYHTYEQSGTFEVTGFMVRKKIDEDGNLGGVAHVKKFKLRININEGLDEDFTYFGSDGFSFIPFKNTLPIIGGYSNQSSYYNSIKRQLGFLDETKTFVKFANDSDKLKTEIALLKMEGKDINELDILPNYIKKRYNDKTIQTEETLINNGTQPIVETLGKHIGDSDLTNIKYYNEPKSIWELFGFEEQDLNQVGKPDESRYWKNIIDINTSIFDREGIDINGSIQNGTLVVDTF